MTTRPGPLTTGPTSQTDDEQARYSGDCFAELSGLSFNRLNEAVQVRKGNFVCSCRCTKYCVSDNEPREM